MCPGNFQVVEAGWHPLNSTEWGPAAPPTLQAAPSSWLAACFSLSNSIRSICLHVSAALSCTLPFILALPLHSGFLLSFPSFRFGTRRTPVSVTLISAFGIILIGHIPEASRLYSVEHGQHHQFTTTTSQNTDTTFLPSARGGDYGASMSRHQISMTGRLYNGANKISQRLWVWLKGPGRQKATVIASRFTHQVQRNLTSRRLLSFPHLVVLIWMVILLWGERWVFDSKVHDCDWHNWEKWVSFPRARYMIVSFRNYLLNDSRSPRAQSLTI